MCAKNGVRSTSGEAPSRPHERESGAWARCTCCHRRWLSRLASLQIRRTATCQVPLWDASQRLVAARPWRAPARINRARCAEPGAHRTFGRQRGGARSQSATDAARLAPSVCAWLEGPQSVALSRRDAAARQVPASPSTTACTSRWLGRGGIQHTWWQQRGKRVATPRSLARGRPCTNW